MESNLLSHKKNGITRLVVHGHLAGEKETEIVDCDMMPCVELSTLQEVLERRKRK
jgi:hypothetical protein